MSKLQVLLVLASAYLLCFSSAEELQITGGKIKGKLGKSEAGVEVREFLGIKYGKPFCLTYHTIKKSNLPSV